MASLYGIIDTARDERLYDLVKACPQHVCLFAGKLDPELERASPFLVKLEPENSLARAWATEGKGRAWGIQVVSSADLSELRRHFRTFLQAKLPDGRVVLFRFYDPRVWRSYLPTCDVGEIARWFAFVDRYWCEVGKSGEGWEYRSGHGRLIVKASQR